MRPCAGSGGRRRWPSLRAPAPRCGRTWRAHAPAWSSSRSECAAALTLALSLSMVGMPAPQLALLSQAPSLTGPVTPLNPDHAPQRYALPGDATVNVYRHRKTRVDELRPPSDLGDGGDMGGEGPSMEGVDELSRELLKVRTASRVCLEVCICWGCTLVRLGPSCYRAQPRSTLAINPIACTGARKRALQRAVAVWEEGGEGGNLAETTSSSTHALQRAACSCADLLTLQCVCVWRRVSATLELPAGWCLRAAVPANALPEICARRGAPSCRLSPSARCWWCPSRPSLACTRCPTWGRSAASTPSSGPRT